MWRLREVLVTRSYLGEQKLDGKAAAGANHLHDLRVYESVRVRRGEGRERST